MTADRFRNLALALPGAVESSHMRHPDFRANGKIFATLGYPNDGWGMVKLTPKQQQDFTNKAPKVFIPCKGVWGERGATNVHLPSARVAVVRPALKTAWRNVTEQTSSQGA
jgi:hypothetical protein